MRTISRTVRLTPVEDDPANWKADEMLAQENEWTIDISDYISDLNRALKHWKLQNGPAFKPFTQADFEVGPKLKAILTNGLSDLELGRGFFRLRGLLNPEWNDQERRIVLWGLGTYLGWGERQDKVGNLIHEVRNTNMKMNQNSSVRGFQTNQALELHTDGCDVFSLWVLQGGKSGGVSLLGSAVAAFNEIVRTRPDLAKVLQEDFHFDARGQHPLGLKVQVHPVYSFYKGRLSIIKKSAYIYSAQRFPDVPKLTSIQKEALDYFDEVINDDKFVMRFMMQKGDMIVANNHCLVHGRTAFVDNPDNPRHCLRLWLTLPAPRIRELPPHYAQTREYIHTMERIQSWSRRAKL